MRLVGNDITTNKMLLWSIMRITINKLSIQIAIDIHVGRRFYLRPKGCQSLTGEDPPESVSIATLVPCKFACLSRFLRESETGIQQAKAEKSDFSSVQVYKM